MRPVAMGASPIRIRVRGSETCSHPVWRTERFSLPREREPDARDIAAHRQDLQIEHQPRVIRIRSRYADRPVQVRQGVAGDILLGLLDAPFHFAHGFEILVYLPAVGRAKGLPEPGDVVFHKIEQTGAVVKCGLTIRFAAALTEQRFEDQSRVRLGRERCRR